MRQNVLIAIFTLSSCWSPDESKIILLCDESNPCPENQSCVEGHCQSVPLDMASQENDMRDMTMSENGCAPGISSIPVGMAFACPGKFSKGNARKQCAVNWKVCDNGSKVDLTECNKLNGFFTGDKAGYDSGSPDLAMCGADPGTGNRDWFGCGKRTTYLYDARTACGNFPKVLSCQPSSGWDCFSGTTLDLTINNNDTDGTLCCKT